MTSTLPPRAQLQDCRLYRFWVTHPLTGEVVLGYIGETVRQPFERLLEHLATQPWFDTVVRWEVDEQVFAGKPAVLAAEAAAIRAERPLYNVKENMGNPVRVKPWEAVAQRRRRDDEAGRPRWVQPADTGPRTSTKPAPARPSTVRASRRGPSSRWQVAAGCAVTGWALMAWMLWTRAGHATWGTQEGRAWFSAVAPLVMLGWGAWFGPRVWRRMCRRVRRWFR